MYSASLKFIPPVLKTCSYFTSILLVYWNGILPAFTTPSIHCLMWNLTYDFCSVLQKWTQVNKTPQFSRYLVCLIGVGNIYLNKYSYFPHKEILSISSWIFPLQQIDNLILLSYSAISHPWILGGFTKMKNVRKIFKFSWPSPFSTF